MANTGKMNLLEEEGRIKSEPQTKNVKAEEKRVVGEIKKATKQVAVLVLNMELKDLKVAGLTNARNRN